MVVTQHAQTLVRSAYDPNVQEAWTTCSTGHNWGYYYVLGVLPFLARFVQSLRRYYDSRLPTHLINAGKYGMGMVYYFFYYFWRHNNNQPSGYSFVLWVLFGTIYSLYACAWDFLMDWSLFQRNARYPLLRKEVMYTGHIPLYYVAFITNFLLRFSWLSYFPTGGINITVRTFIAAFLEILRRVQWNFYRLENEHLGNMDQYRATREVPLPYSDAAHAHDEDDEEDRDEDGHPQGSWLRRTLSIHSRRSQSHAVEEAT
ncbi:EXS-domain-containing protein [Coniophora puteana RWD-64-598 SS2]|uniref:EXS-domain-containing protein n=1 Tax=Coniophora puteana (strain RWD-64-598) TaxID=741705 RepID=A0A5M3MGY7_CONPW|nr:EXS-domain-containing protein [Coniophora puteana RWD-64-598 SS2]EIW78498.1 EXS-domain-containing protein [Coniophora puteana RWD-64-598 SS2]